MRFLMRSPDTATLAIFKYLMFVFDVIGIGSHTPCALNLFIGVCIFVDLEMFTFTHFKGVLPRYFYAPKKMVILKINIIYSLPPLKLVLQAILYQIFVQESSVLL